LRRPEDGPVASDEIAAAAIRQPPEHALPESKAKIAARVRRTIFFAAPAASGNRACARADWPVEGRPMPLRNVTLDDKYDLGQSRVFITGCA
jgi:hypothetical protein